MAREIEELCKVGLDITIMAARQQYGCGCAKAAKVLYRPFLFSAEAMLSIGYMLFRHPLALPRLICLMLRLARSSATEAISLMANLHTVGFFARCLDRESISHIHACFLSWPAVIGLALSVTTGRNFSISAHARDIFVEHGAVALKAARAKFITVCTRQGLDHLKANLPATYHHKLHLNYHGVTIPSQCLRHSQQTFSKSKNSDTIIAVGRLIKKKGLASLVKAFALVVQTRSHCRLIIVGDGPERKQITELVRQLALADSVQLLGWQESDVTMQLIKQATILVAPSAIADDGDRDGIPNVILEAFAGATPVIASNLGGISEVVQHRKTGLLVKSGDAGELASVIEQLLNDKDLQSRLSQTAYEKLLESFDSERNSGRLANLFMSSN